MFVRKINTVWIVVTVTPAALGGVYTLSHDGQLTLSGNMSTDLEGSLIGDWDADTNPDGTQTLPGVWGGSGNNPIPITMTLAVGFNGTSVPEGTLNLDIQDKGNTATVSNLDWNVLGEELMTASMTATALYETFRSVNPDSLFPGGIPIEFPIGEGYITACALLQSGPGVGTANPVDDQPGVHALEVAVPVTMDLLIVTEALGELPLQLPLMLLIEGTHHIGDANDMLMISASSFLNETTDLPPEPLPTIPMELPTVLPPGDNAGVLINLTPSTVSTTVEIDADLTAMRPYGPIGDLNGDGIVGTDDLLAILAAYGTCPGCPEDLNGDGIVNVNEILIIIDNWT